MNNRQLKKQIHGLCGGIAADTVKIAAELDLDPEKVRPLVIEAARAQQQALKRMSVAFDKSPKEFDNAKAYAQARSAYYKSARKALTADLTAALTKIAKELNALSAEKK